MRELSLFSGAGGGVLASRLLGFNTIGYVEYEEYCQKIIEQRITDGLLDAAPIFGDIRTFISEGYADSYKGMVDVLTGGFPCQPFSVAGKKAGADDPRNMWPQTVECLRRVRPRYGFFENVPGLLNSGYFPTILREISESGYAVRWCTLGADDVGAPHRRKRLWILAYSEGVRGIRELRELSKKNESQRKPEECRKKEAEQLEYASEFGGWWDKDPAEYGAEPRLGRVAYGVANRVDRLKAIGNGQVPAVAAAAWHVLCPEI